MLGAILGDIIGSPYEFDIHNIKTTEFPLFNERSGFTDDTVMTLAVAEGLMNGFEDPGKTEGEITKSMQALGRKYPDAGYGTHFNEWLREEKPKPYNSLGNGSAMRVSAAAWLYNNLRDVELYAELSAKGTHNHPEGVKGARVTAAAIFLARQGADKTFIRRYIEEKYQYRFDRSCDEIRPYYHHVETCQETVPEAMTAFFEGNSFEEVIRLAVSLGGDSDTLTAIAGSIAEAYYPIPEPLRRKALSMLDDELLSILKKYRAFLKEIRDKRYGKIKKLMSYQPFFDAGGKTEWFVRPPEGEARSFAYPRYGEEVACLEEFAQDAAFADFDYAGTIELAGLKMDLDLYKDKAQFCCPLVLRAMLTSIVRQERFWDGLIGKAVEEGTVSAILDSLEKQMSPKIL